MTEVSVETKALSTTPDMEVDGTNDSKAEDLPEDCFLACAMVQDRIGRDYPGFRPTGLVDAQMVSKQVAECHETLHVASISSGLIETVDKLKVGLEKYSGAINTVMDHLRAVSAGAKDDFDRICENRLMQDFGLLPTKSKCWFMVSFGFCALIGFSLEPLKNRLIPTVPVWFIRRHCDLGSKYLGGVASDRQARMVAALSVISNTHSKLNGSRWTENFNSDGVLFGDSGFRNLPTFCQL